MVWLQGVMCRRFLHPGRSFIFTTKGLGIGASHQRESVCVCHEVFEAEWEWEELRNHVGLYSLVSPVGSSMVSKDPFNSMKSANWVGVVEGPAP